MKNRTTEQDVFDPDAFVLSLHEEKSEAEKGASCLNKNHCIEAHHLLWIMPGINAFNKANETLKGLKDEKLPLSCSFSFAALSAIASLAMSGRFTYKGIIKTCKMLKNKKLPSNWPSLSKKKKRLLMTLGLMTAAYVVFADGIQSFFYADSLPKDYEFNVNEKEWHAVCVAMAVITGLTVTFSEGLETIKALIKFFSDKKTAYTNKFSAIVSPAIGVTLGLFGAAQDVISSFTGMRKVLSIQSLPGTAMIALLSFLNGSMDFSLNGRFNIKSMDKLIKHLAEHHKITKKEAAALLLSALAAGCLAYAVQSLSESFLRDTANEFRFSIPDPVITTLSYGAAANEFATDTSSLFQASYFIVDSISRIITNSLNTVYQKIASYCVKPEENDIEAQIPLLEDDALREREINHLIEEKEKTPLPSNERNMDYYREGNPSLLFTQPVSFKHWDKSKENKSRIRCGVM